MTKLTATNGRKARQECKSLWPAQDVKLHGFNKQDKVVFITLVRGKTKGHVASAMIPDQKVVRWEAQPVTFGD